MATLHKDLSQLLPGLLSRGEDTERRLDIHTQVVKELKNLMKNLQLKQRNMAYNIEV